MGIIILFLIFCFGAVIGSFLNVVILRLPKDQNLGGRSHCSKCGHELGFFDLFPIVSYILLFGKCRYCKNKISPRYLLIELICGLLFTSAFFILDPSLSAQSLLEFAKWLVLICVCVVSFTVDLEYYVVLFYVVMPATIFFLLADLFIDFFSGNFARFSAPVFTNGLLGCLLGALPFLLLWYLSKFWTGQKGKWMGFGDVELGACLGAALGWPLSGLNIFLSVILGGIVSLLLLSFTKKNLKSQIPFGTFLSFTCILTLFYGDRILHWYLAIIGF